DDFDLFALLEELVGSDGPDVTGRTGDDVHGNLPEQCGGKGMRRPRETCQGGMIRPPGFSVFGSPSCAPGRRKPFSNSCCANTDSAGGASGRKTSAAARAMRASSSRPSFSMR